MLHKHRLRLVEVPVRMRERAARALVDPRRCAPSTTWRRCCSRSWSARSAAARRRWRTHDPRVAGTPLKVSIAATAASLLLLLVVFELIRSRRLRERYALLWLLTGLVLLVLSAWRGGLNTIAGWVGVETYPPAVLFAVALLFVLAVLLHYSTVISKVTDQNVILAQRARAARARAQRALVGAGAGRSGGTRSAQRAEQHRDRRRGQRQRLPERRVVVAAGARPARSRGRASRARLAREPAERARRTDDARRLRATRASRCSTRSRAGRCGSRRGPPPRA